MSHQLKSDRERELPLTLVTEESQEAGGQEAGGRLGRRRKYYSNIEQHSLLSLGAPKRTLGIPERGYPGVTSLLETLPKGREVWHPSFLF